MSDECITLAALRQAGKASLAELHLTPEFLEPGHQGFLNIVDSLRK
jgi:hypothetical protein